jgi:hypothetical protein
MLSKVKKMMKDVKQCQKKHQRWKEKVSVNKKQIVIKYENKLLLLRTPREMSLLEPSYEGFTPCTRGTILNAYFTST